MTAHVEPDASSPCWGGPLNPFDPRQDRPVRWPEREWRAMVTCVDNGDGTVTATAVPFSEGPYIHQNPQTVTKTIKIEDHTVKRVSTGQKPGPRHGKAMRSIMPSGGALRWRVIGDPEGEQVFSEKARAEARAAAINNGELDL